MQSRIKLAAFGGKGMLGSDLVKFLGGDCETFAIDKENYDESRDRNYDILINANGNSRRFWANENPYEDFEASTASVYKSISDFRFKKYIYISSSDVYPEHSNPEKTSEKGSIDFQKLSPYGFHKYLAEEIVRHRAKSYLILRCSMILGTNLKKGPFYDILSGKPLFISLDSRLQLITSLAVAEAVKELLRRSLDNEIFNVGGRGSFSFENIGANFKNGVAVLPEAEKQEYEMDVSKLNGVYPLKTSEDYLKDFLKFYESKI